MCESVNRVQLANELHCRGYSCAQAVACAFCDVLPYGPEELAPFLGCFGGGFRAGEICGAVSGAAVVLGLTWPHRAAEDLAAKELAGEKVRAFQRRFLERFPSLRCGELKGRPDAQEGSAAAARIGFQKSCAVYIAAAVEILEEMLAEEAGGKGGAG